MNTLKNAVAKDKKSGKDIDFDFDRERQLSLHKYLGADLLEDVIPALKRANFETPDELWISYDIESDACHIEVSYLSTLNTDKNVEKNDDMFSKTIHETVEQWIKELKNPEEKLLLNSYDYPDFLGEDFMLDLDV